MNDISKQRIKDAVEMLFKVGAQLKEIAAGFYAIHMSSLGTKLEEHAAKASNIGQFILDTVEDDDTPKSKDELLEKVLGAIQGHDKMTFGEFSKEIGDRTRYSTWNDIPSSRHHTYITSASVFFVGNPHPVYLEPHQLIALFETSCHDYALANFVSSDDGSIQLRVRKWKKP